MDKRASVLLRKESSETGEVVHVRDVTTFPIHILASQHRLSGVLRSHLPLHILGSSLLYEEVWI